jgi:hypothetical protein
MGCWLRRGGVFYFREGRERDYTPLLINTSVNPAYEVFPRAKLRGYIRGGGTRGATSWINQAPPERYTATSQNMIKQSKLLAPSGGNGQTSPESRAIRVCRGNQVLGKWSSTEVQERLASENLVPLDLFYDEKVSEWLPLSELRVKPAKTAKSVKRPCYCGSGLPFQICCGDGRKC